MQIILCLIILIATNVQQMAITNTIANVKPAQKNAKLVIIMAVIHVKMIEKITHYARVNPNLLKILLQENVNL